MSIVTKKEIENPQIESITRKFKKKSTKIKKQKMTKEQMWKQIKRDKVLYILLLIPIIYFIVFKYIPMSGIVLAFRKYEVGGSMFGSEWVGFKYFNMFLKDPYFWKIFKNTFVLSLSSLIIGFPIPIILALMLNEVQSPLLKRSVQTVSYLPKFFSTVVVVSMISIMLSPSSGIINSILSNFGMEEIYFLKETEWFRPVYIISEVWQFTGWNAILYIAALTNIDPQLYEAASIDGANRWVRMVSVTIPGIMPTIAITLILSTGSILSVGFEKVLLLYNNSTMEVADVIQTYVYRMGILSSNYSYSTAVGLFQAVINLGLISLVNYISKKTTETGLW
ncbi:ABC transporter permease subunit [Clostridioides difficile]